MLWIIMTFLLINAGIFIFSYLRTKDINLKTSDGYFLGGRSLTALYIGSSLLLTNLSTEQMVGLNGQSYSGTMSAMAWEVTAPLALIMLAFVFLPRYLSSGVTTIPDFLEKRYDQRTRQIVSILLLLGYATSFLPTVLYSGALVLDQVFNISSALGISTFATVFFISLVIGAASCCYIFFGGLKAAASADAIYGAGLILGGLFIFVLGIMAIGDGSLLNGYTELTSVHKEKLNAITADNAAEVPWPTIFTGLLVNNLFYWAVNQSIVQRALGAKNLAEGQKGALLAGVFKTIGVFYLVLPGVIAYHLYGGHIENADTVYPKLIVDLLPTALIGVFAAILFGAILSSFNGSLNSTITLFTLDLYKPIFKPEAKEEELVKTGRIFVVILAAVSIIIAPFILFAPSGLYNYLQEMFGFFNVPVLAAVVVGFFTKKVPALAVKWAIFAHIVLYTISKIYFGHIHFLYILAVLFPFSVLLMLFIGKLKPRPSEFKLEKNAKVDLRPWKHAKLASILVICLMACIYLLFSPWGLAK
ncbi:solute:sodium symporter family transporter [Bacillus paralicheniformis]|uniref:Sodium/myo-inositol cotransporter n=1 Tax=Bacillus paralicheniformis TaxID=1648923 RepID=A0A6I7TQ16_9BACI|nr:MULTISPECIES: solute:sodium symporter family transporter [Bacillus]ETB72277.1 AraC family transcriptional regulator [Bacillus sp. CPSM8]KUL07843.1 AraC family transcriptional regulator [Bacillus licheniformis LMG 7559]MBC8623462.1 solute:sodium symporter family transporter [Robertmurraya crescens]POO76991.1 solute:sodium symporter family transporter [Bacillus sp. MBGLi97]AGN36641.1 putativ Na+/solute symporter YidK [Bacillus paralicheniformis ATCC 9945a]